MEPEALILEVSRRIQPTPKGLLVELDGEGHIAIHVKRDLLHLDADALNDRLHAWIAREVRFVLPMASALVSFRHARPATYDDAELDTQEKWLALEPTLRLDLTPFPSVADIEKFAALVPRFLEVVREEGRPEGWRDIEEGNAE